MALLTGLLIPSSVIASAAQDFVDVNQFQNPLWYCVSSAALAAGTFLVCDLRGFCAADKVIGKATAFLYVLMGVNSVYFPTSTEWQC